MARRARTEVQHASAFDDRPAQAERHRGHAVLGLQRCLRIEVVRPRHAREIGIEPRPVLGADDLLNDDRHLLFFEAVGRRPQVGLGVAQEGRRIHPLHRLHQPRQALVVVGMPVGQHERVVHARERLVLRILEQARRPHRQRPAHLPKEHVKICHHVIGKACGEEPSQQDLVVRAVDGDVEQVVVGEEPVEDIGANHHRRRHAHLHAGKTAVHAMQANQPPHEREPARLAANGAAANAGEERHRCVERLPVEVAYLQLRLIVAVLGDGGYEPGAQLLGGLVVGDAAGAQAVCEGELGARRKPRGEVIPFAVVHDALDLHRGQHLFEAAQVLGAPQLSPVGHAEHEVAEREVLHDEPVQFAQHRRRPLEHERQPRCFGALQVLGAPRLHQDRHVGHLLANGARQVEPRIPRQNAPARELDVGDDPEHVVLVRRPALPRFLVRRAQQDLGARAQPHQLVRQVAPFAQRVGRLPDDLGVHRGQQRRVVPHAVFDEQHHAHARRGRVVRDVALVLDVVDHRQQDARVALPHEAPVDARQVGARLKLLELAVVVRQHQHRHVEPRVGQLLRELRRVHVARVDRRDHQVELALCRGLGHRLRAARHVRDVRRVMRVEVDDLAHHQLVQPAVFLQRERIVQARHEQDVLHPVGHQVLKQLRRQRIRCRRHPSALAHGLRPRGAQTAPWSIIALATFRKPAMFAPFTRLPGVPYSAAAPLAAL